MPPRPSVGAPAALGALGRIGALAFITVLGALTGYLGGQWTMAPTEPPPVAHVGRRPGPPSELAAATEAELPADVDEPAPVAPPDVAAPVSPAEERNREAVRLTEQGDLAAAVDLLRAARQLDPGNELYRRNLQAALVNAGFADLNAERFESAIAHLEEARALGDSGQVDRGLGYAYYRLGKRALARTALERAVEQGAGDAETYVTLGRLYLERREQPRALAMLEQAISAGADAPGLADTVARLRRDEEVERDYETIASSHFVVKLAGREDTPAGRLVLNALEDAYRRVGARFAYYPLERLEVILYPDETFRAVTDSPHWSGGIYDGRIKLPVGGIERGTEQLARTVRHEYAHAAIVTLSRGRAPIWLNEGLAQVAEETNVEGRAGRLRLALAEGGLIPLTELEGSFTGFDRTRASLAYAEAYFAARWLLDKKGGYNIRRLLEAMATAENTDTALRQTLSLPYEELNRRVLADLPRLAAG